ncbi:MAG TPA: PDDEXK nuclease domain-containing protein [Chthonomonadaceae bacterium]|nr:PDDEXK nuclease domain-containing protein [Chthonomonadaceae bacterium]
MSLTPERIPPKKQASPPDVTGLLGDIRQLIEQARERMAVAVNRELTLLHWHIGDRIRKDILREERAPYGEQIVITLSAHLTQEFGRGFSRTNILYMMQFAEEFPDLQIVQSVIGQLSWTHILLLLPIKDRLKQDFYAEMCRLEKWSVRTLRAKIGGMLYERTTLSGKAEEVIQAEIDALRKEDQLTPDLVFRDPYLLDFLGLHDGYSEQDLENAIIREMEAFLLELGAGFAFVARQKRMTIDDEDFYLDLLFYHLDLRRFIAIELKLNKFTAAYKGQMELYLRWLDRYERRPNDEPPIGLILCSQKSHEQIELLQLDRGDIRVAEYFTKRLPPPLLEQELHKAIRRAREQLAQRGVEEPEKEEIEPKR